MNRTISHLQYNEMIVKPTVPSFYLFLVSDTAHKTNTSIRILDDQRKTLGSGQSSIIYERHFAERHFAERHFAERQFAEWTFCRTDILPNGQFAERTTCRK